jgi:hypothetical protein
LQKTTLFKIKMLKALPLQPGNAKLIDDERLRELLDELQLGNKHGCYVYACGGPHGSLIPIYVGKAANTIFRNECSSDRNLRMVEAALNQKKKQVAYLFLAVHPEQKGPLNKKCISELEEALIEQAHRVNPNLSNIHMLPRRNWEIEAVTKPKMGPTGADAKSFAKLLAFEVVKQKKATKTNRKKKK